MRITDTSDLWWKTAVVYCLDVETFLDADDDGIGDLPGLAQRLDYLEALGVTCLWLMPFYPTPDRDDGYDIVDFYGVDRRLGSHGDLVEVIRTARDRGLRVIADLVVNHTSDQHPWFQEARRSRQSPFRDFYVWVDEPPPGPQPEPIFPDQESSVWSWDEEAGQYYLHRFYRHQPDLNVANPRVRDEIAKVIGFWLELGLSGFRVDAVPFLLETLGVPEAEDTMPDPHEFLAHVREFLNRRHGEAVLLGEVNLPREEQLRFFGGDSGGELTMQFDFVGMQRMYLALARQDAGPLADALAGRPAIAPTNQWATFVRNHDELTLDKLSEEERQEVFAAFGPEPEMQIYGRGLIRRLPPMLGGDRQRIRMVYSLLFALPGTPVLFYGEEIGMGENLAAGDRNAVRTPMQWDGSANGGFSRAPAERLTAPVVEGSYGPAAVNVADQLNRPDSLLTFIQRLARCYRSCPELGWGEGTVLDAGDPALLALRSSLDEHTVLTVHNLSDRAMPARVRVPDLPAEAVVTDLLGTGYAAPLQPAGPLELELEGYGYAWLRISPSGSRRLA